MVIPFSIDASGSVATVTDPVRSLADRVHALIATLPGQRVMRSTFGVPITEVMFAWDDNIGQMQLDQMVREAIALWEPSAQVISVRPVFNPDGSEVLSADVDISAGDPVSSGVSPVYAIQISSNGEVTRVG